MSTDTEHFKSSLLISKDGTKIYVLAWQDAKLWEHPIDNPIPQNGIEYDIIIPELDEGQFHNFAYSISWYNLDNNDYNIILAANPLSGFDVQVFKYDILTNVYQKIYNTGRWTLDIEPIYGLNCNQLCDIGTPMPSICNPNIEIETCEPNKCNEECVGIPVLYIF